MQGGRPAQYIHFNQHIGYCGSSISGDVGIITGAALLSLRTPRPGRVDTPYLGSEVLKEVLTFPNTTAEEVRHFPSRETVSDR